MTNWSALVGIPYAFGGRDPAAGLDCWGLVRLLRPDAPEFDEPTLASARVRIDTEARQWVSVDAPASGDVLLMGRGRLHHAGVCISPGLVIHSSKPLGVVVERLAALRQRYPNQRAYRAPERIA